MSMIDDHDIVTSFLDADEEYAALRLADVVSDGTIVKIFAADDTIEDDFPTARDIRVYVVKMSGDLIMSATRTEADSIPAAFKILTDNLL